MNSEIKNTLLYDESLNSKTYNMFIVCMLLIFMFLNFFQPFNIIGISMEPTLIEGNKLLSSNINSDYYVGNIIVFNHGNELFVKRIVGKEEDLVEIIDNKICINSSPIENSYVYTNNNPFSGTIPKDSYYVLGDNLSNSMDSRCFGLVHKDDIVAKIIFNFNTLSSYN